MKKYRIGRRAGMIMFTILLLSCGGKSIRSESEDLIAMKLENGAWQLENNKISVIIDPQYGGRVFSFYNKMTGEELIQPYMSNAVSTGGAFYDIIDLVWPGTAKSVYEVSDVDLNKEENELSITMSYRVGDEFSEKKGLLITKTFMLDSFSTAIHSEVKIENKSKGTIEFAYWHQTRPLMEATNKSTWLQLDDDIVEIPFSPGSGGHGTAMVPSDGFMGLTGEGMDSSLAWLFNESQIQNFWTWHDIQIPTYDLVFQPVELYPGRFVSYKIDLALLPAMDEIDAGELDSGMVGTLNADYADGIITVNGGYYKYSSDKYVDVNVKVELIDGSGDVVSVIQDEQVSAIHPEEMVDFTANADISEDIIGGYYQVKMTITSGGKDLLVAERSIKLGEVQVPDFDQNLTLTFMWELHQPLYPDSETSSNQISEFAEIYSNIAVLYNNHPDIHTDICMSGTLLYQLAQYYPQIIEQYRELIDSGTFEMLATGFGHPLFPFISLDQIGYQIEMDIAFKEFLFDVQPKGIQMPEMGFTNGIIQPMTINGIRWGYFSRLAIENGYSDIPDLDYYKPSSVVSSSGVLDALIRDPDAVNIILKKTDRAVDEFIQYLIEVQEGNEKGDRTVVVANNGEFIGDGVFMEMLFERLEEIPWIDFKNGDEVFDDYDPTQTFLGDKIYGSWYYDMESEGTSFRLWFDTAVKQDIWQELTNGETTVLRIDEKIKLAESSTDIDTSYPASLFEATWEALIIAEQSDWIWAGNQESYDIINEQITYAMNTTAGVYENLILLLRDKELEIPSYTNYVEMLEDNQEDYYFYSETNKFEIWNLETKPENPTQNSAISIRFNIYDRENGVNYNNVYALLKFESTDKYYLVKADFMFDGSMKAFIGGVPSGEMIQAYIYAEDLAGQVSISDPFEIEVE